MRSPFLRPTLALCAGFLAITALADESKPADKPADKVEAKAEQSVTQHRITVGGTKIDYTATAGTLIVRNDEDKPIASMGYVAYVRANPRGAPRPITFAFNGGPGSSSMWLHVGILGPRRVEVVDAAPTPPAPYKLVDNAYGLIDKSDLVLIDPVGTGISRAAGDSKDEDFYSVDPDIDSFVRFIAQYVSDNQRWNSPKYLLGESYGTTRGAAIVEQLQSKRNMIFNGVILVSVATDIGALDDTDADRPYALELPTYTVTAWYHKLLPGPARELQRLLQEVREFAIGPYTTALMKGDAIPEAERDAIAERLHEYTGLSVDYLKAAKLRVHVGMFMQELKRGDGLTVGRLDTRFLGLTPDPLARDAVYDPQASSITGAFTATFLDYYHGDLKFGAGKTYWGTHYEIGRNWKMTHQGPNGEQPSVNTSPDLGAALVFNPSLRVLVLNGMMDLATPFFGAEYMMTHLRAPAEVQKRIDMKYYMAGHMMYLEKDARAQMKRDVDAFIDATSRAGN
jgi:carboxypeptidase C (cathepsin A)